MSERTEDEYTRRAMEVSDAVRDAQLAVLRAIPEAIGEGGAGAVVMLAEAYAWLTVPGVSHGGAS